MNCLRRINSVLTKNVSFLRKYASNIHEPDYLEAMKPKVPLHDVINIQIRGYDFSILENYQRLIHNLAKNMEIEVEENWACPAQDMHINTYKANSEVLNSQYKLKIYERTVQITDVSTLQLPILLRALDASAPPGVSVDVVKHEDYHEEVRYVPDQELLTLKQELEEMGGARKVK